MDRNSFIDVQQLKKKWLMVAGRCKSKSTTSNPKKIQLHLQMKGEEAFWLKSKLSFDLQMKLSLLRMQRKALGSIMARACTTAFGSLAENWAAI